MCAGDNQDSWWSTTLSLYIYHLISYMNKFRNRLSVNFISVSCISRRQLFILVRNKSVVPLYEWYLLWSHYGYEWVILILILMIVIWSLIKYCNAKDYPNLIMTLSFKSWLVWWSLEILDLLIHANHASLGKMTETSHSGKTEFALIVEIHT